jgi:hypothetical protein
MNNKRVNDYDLKIILNLSKNIYWVYIQTDALDIDSIFPDFSNYGDASRTYDIVLRILLREEKIRISMTDNSQIIDSEPEEEGGSDPQ